MLPRSKVWALVSGASPRPDLHDAFRDQDVFELPDDHFLIVHRVPGVEGKGDIWDGPKLRRFTRWARRVHRDAQAGRKNSVSHWWWYSRARERLPERVPELIAVLADRLGIGLDLTYASLDPISQWIEAHEPEEVFTDFYDPLVAFVGELQRVRTDGEWRIEDRKAPPYPYLSSSKHRLIMPINVVFESIGGPTPADLRKAAADEVRRATLR